MQHVIHKAGAALGVKAGEGRLVALLLLMNFLVGVGRSFASTAGNALFLERFGADKQPYLYILTSLLVPALASTYMAFERRLSFARLLMLSFVVQALLTGLLRVFLSVTDAGWVTFVSPLGFEVILFLTNVCYWTLAGQLLDVRQAKRLFPLIGAGEWVAMVIGGFATPTIVGVIGTANLFLISATGLGSALVIARVLLRDNSSSSTGGGGEQEAADESDSKVSAQSPLKNPYIFFMLINNALSMVGFFFVDNALNGMAEQRFTNADQLAGFLGQLWAWMAIAVLLSRGFFSSRLLGRFGVNVGLLALPVSVFVGAVAFCIVGKMLGLTSAVTFGILVFTRFVDGLFRFDLDATAGLILYQPLPPALRSWTQVTNDGVFMPVAIGVSGLLLLFLKSTLGFDALGIMYFVPVITLIWAISGFSVTSRYPSMVAAALTSHRFDTAALSLNDSTSLDLLKARLQSQNVTEVLYALALLEESDPESLRATLPQLLDHPQPEVRREALRVLARLDVRLAIPEVRERLQTDDCLDVRGEAIRTIAKLEEDDAFEEIVPFSKSDEPALRVAAIVGLMRHVGMEGVVAAMDQFAKLRDSADPTQRMLAARILGDIEIQNFYRPLLPLLRDENLDVRYEALIAAGKLKNPRLWPDVLAALNMPHVQSAAMSALVDAGTAVLPLLEQTFEDQASQPELRVRLIRILQQIRGERVVAFLERHFEVAHHAVYPRLLMALSACQYHVSASESSRILEKVREECRFSGWLLSVLAALPDTDSVHLLRDALEELQRQCRERIYLLMAFVYDSRLIRNSQNNLEHPSPERRAYAIELVDSIIAQELKPFVMPLLEELPVTERQQRLKGVVEPVTAHFTTFLNDILVRDEARTTDWLRICAAYCISELRLTECTKAIVATIENTCDSMLCQTSVWALSKLDPPAYRQQIARLSTSMTQCVKSVDEAPAESRTMSQHGSVETSHSRIRACRIAAGQADFVERLIAAIENRDHREQGTTPMLLDIEKLLILKTVPIFAEAPDHVLAQVVSILEEQEFAADQRVFEKGDLGTSMYVIVSGKVRVHLEDRELTVLGERQVFGELALLDPEPRSASVTATEPTLLFKISQSAIYELMANHIEITRGIMKVLCRRIRQVK